ncbi:hypothetical protein ACTJKE_36605, partial [Ensifer sp. 22521]
VDTFQGTAAELNGDTITDYQIGEKIELLQSLTSLSQVRLSSSSGNTLLEIDTDNNGSFETEITLTGSVDGSFVLTSQDGYTNNVVRIVSEGSGIPTSGDDLLIGTSGADSLDGLGGNDEIVGLG